MKKILVIDDEEGFGQMLKYNLEGTNRYTVQIETRGLQALSAARDFKPDLILMDIMMADLSGSEAAAQIRADEAFEKIPIIFVTATVTAEEVNASGSKIGGQEFLAKPVGVTALLECLQKNLANSSNTT